MPMPSSQKPFISFLVRYLVNVAREYEGNRFKIDILLVFFSDRYFEFFYQGRNYFRAIFSSQVSKIYNGVLTRRL